MDDGHRICKRCKEVKAVFDFPFSIRIGKLLDVCRVCKQGARKITTDFRILRKNADIASGFSVYRKVKKKKSQT